VTIYTVNPERHKVNSIYAQQHLCERRNTILDRAESELRDDPHVMTCQEQAGRQAGFVLESHNHAKRWQYDDRAYRPQEEY
jgi:hypothetical protein